MQKTWTKQMAREFHADVQAALKGVEEKWGVTVKPFGGQLDGQRFTAKIRAWQFAHRS